MAVELGAAGARVYVTGRTTRQQRSECDRPETIEETAVLIEAQGGTATAIAGSPRSRAVRAFVQRIDAEHGRLDVLVNDIWGGEGRFEWDAPLWATDLDGGRHPG